MHCTTILDHFEPAVYHTHVQINFSFLKSTSNYIVDSAPWTPFISRVMNLCGAIRASDVVDSGRTSLGLTKITAAQCGPGNSLLAF